jgi:hypothetical protein
MGERGVEEERGVAEERGTAGSASSWMSAIGWVAARMLWAGSKGVCSHGLVAGIYVCWASVGDETFFI